MLLRIRIRTRPESSSLVVPDITDRVNRKNENSNASVTGGERDKRWSGRSAHAEGTRDGARVPPPVTEALLKMVDAAQAPLR